MIKPEVKRTQYIHRTNLEKDLLGILKTKSKSELFYLRGRRRVGKSTLLKYLEKQCLNAFYFIGFNDESGEKTLARFAKKWDQFTGKRRLSLFRKTELDWPIIFDEITAYVAEIEDNQNLILIFDEIQWIAKGLSGFVGCLKEKWLNWEKTQKIKLIICGSSNKFFFEQTGGEEKILRGLKTKADFVLPPLHLLEVKKHYFSTWKDNEVFLAYMLLGGVPYYLNQLNYSEGFIACLNSAVFTSTSIFLKEVDEILNLEFNKAGLSKAKQILSAMGPLGSTQTQIREKIKISESTLSEAMVKLVDYGIIKEKKLHSPKNFKPHGHQYFYDDPYLLFYFGVLEKYTEEILDNDDRLILPQVFVPQQSYYIPNFTGRAFEILIRNLFVCETNDSQKILLKQLGITDKKYQLFDSYDGTGSIDFFIEHKFLRLFYAIECKWTSSQKVLEEGIVQLQKFQEQQFRDNKSGFGLDLVLITNALCGKSVLQKARRNQIRIVELSKIFKFKS